MTVNLGGRLSSITYTMPQQMLYDEMGLPQSFDKTKWYKKNEKKKKGNQKAKYHPLVQVRVR